MKLCTVIAYYDTSITKEFKFLNSHCSIVCGYCSVLCLTVKSIEKMIKPNQSSFKLNEIHRVYNPFNEDPKDIIFSREALISGRDGWKIQGKWAITGTSIVMQIGGW